MFSAENKDKVKNRGYNICILHSISKLVLLNNETKPLG